MLLANVYLSVPARARKHDGFVGRREGACQQEANIKILNGFEQFLIFSVKNGGDSGRMLA